MCAVFSCIYAADFEDSGDWVVLTEYLKQQIGAFEPMASDTDDSMAVDQGRG